MRIGGRGSGGSPPPGGDNRKRAFKAKHRVGQTVRGRVASRDSSGLFWINVDGDELLAPLPPDTPLGGHSLFLILELEPEILLRMVPPELAHGAAIPGLASSYLSLRRAFEQTAAKLLDSLPEQATRDDLLQAGVDAEQAAEALDLTMEAVEALDQALSGSDFRYLPLALPRARGVEALLAPAAGHGLIDLHHPKAGECQIELVLTGERTAYRLLCDHPEHAPDASGLVQAALDGKRAELLRVERLGQGRPTILGLLLAPAPGSQGGLISRSV
ncbi:hypothetical protein [Desulfohalovibrio reitneri]|uniref:hypothetical protein n=1 Tax=Desulfohalovibrio reitneri TaxID=1307759 RepID=UPI0004A77C95|nr:hypothetical protein [Desulfohalovibrio reitneri]